MSSTLPAKLKTAGLTPFATRAAQLEKYRPIVWYWCEYYILQRILSSQLHLGDDETQTYAITLMDTVEQFKQANSANDAIVDDIAAKAYIENFALETFNRGDEAQRTNKVTRQTADTFQAASTFIELLSIWGQIDPEWQVRAKYAKYHALRIAKAIKAGEDPNETNPVVEEPAVQTAEENVDAELKELEQQQSGYRPPTVEDAPATGLPTPSVRTPSAGRPVTSPDKADAHDDVSPIEPTDRNGSLGGGYFPEVPGAQSADTIMGDTPSQHQQQDAGSEADFYSSHSTASPMPGLPGVPSTVPSHPDHANIQQPFVAPPQTPSSFYAPPPPPQPAPAQLPHLQQRAAPPQAPALSSQNSYGRPPGGYNMDDESVSAAQKHAKWAISALNFEDVDTAVKELRIALAALGAG